MNIGVRTEPRRERCGCHKRAIARAVWFRIWPWSELGTPTTPAPRGLVLADAHEGSSGYGGQRPCRDGGESAWL